MRGDRLDYATERTWATTNARDFFPAHSPQYIASKKAQGHGMALLNDQASQWSTPSVADVTGGRKARSGDRSGELLNNSLAPMVADKATWSTPRVTTGAYTRDGGVNGKERLSLEGEATVWSTPTSLSFATSHQPGNSHSYNANMAKANALSSALQAPPTSTPGEWSPNSLLASYLRYRATTCSALRRERRALLLMAIRRRDPKAARKPARHGGAQVRAHRVGWTRERASLWTRPAFRRQLNPRFVEWLMAWPPGSTSFACSETAWRTHAELWRSEISRLSFPAAPPAQLGLFA